VSEQGSDNAAADELASLRAEVARLREALAALHHHESRPARSPRLMEPNPEHPGLTALWRGERGLAWQLFVQAAVTINAVLAVVAVISIAAS
jgi:hypothetical protein